MSNSDRTVRPSRRDINPTRIGRYISLAAGCSVLIGVLSCGDTDGPTGNRAPAAVSISPVELTVEAGKTATLQATVANSEGNTISGARVTWSTSSTTIATVSTTGVVTGVGVGVARITATSGTISGSTLTAVTTATTTPLSVGPGGATVSTPGGEVKVTLPNGAMPAGGTVTITPVTTGNPPGTTVPGTVYKVGVFGITVGPRPTITVRYSVEGLPAGFDERKLVLSRKVGVFWIPLPTVVDVTAKTMTATLPAGFIGSAGLESASLARALGAVDEEIIVGATLFSFETTPPSVQLTVGETRRLTGRVVALASGSAVAISGPTASSSAAGVASLGTPTINGTEVGVDVQAVAPGTAAITLGASTGTGANAAPFAGVVNVTVVSPASRALTITGLPNGVNAAVTVTGPGNFSQTATATRTFNGVTAGAYTIAAQSVSAGGVTYNATPANQTVNVAASQAATASVAYSPPAPCASVSISPLPINVVVGKTVQLTATPRDANGNALTGRTVTFSSSSTAIMAVSSGGVVTGVTIGQATLTVRCENATNTFPVTVSAAPAASVTITPATFRAFIGDTVQLSAVVRDDAGNILTGRTVTWSSSNSSFATVQGQGTVISRAPGNVTIFASADNQTGQSAGALGCFISGNPVTCGNLNVAVQTPGATVTGQRSVVNGYGHLRCVFNITFVPTGGDAGTWFNDVPNWTWNGLEIRSGTNIPGFVDFYQDWQVNEQPAYPPFQINLTWRYRINSTGQIRSVSMPTVTCQ